MFLLILESLGSTELVFILIMALIFFGPRKLPQISRSLGKNLADFRRASEDFKRTWDREVNLEESGGSLTPTNQLELSDQSSIVGNDAGTQPAQPPIVTAAESTFARQTANSDTLQTDLGSEPSTVETAANETKSSPKNDWL